MKTGGVATLLLAGVLFIGGSIAGFRLLTQPTATVSDEPTCQTRQVAKSEKLTSNLVNVDVYNASRTAGLANRVSTLLQRRSFLAGQIANNPTDITTDNIVIVAADETAPQVKLVRAQFGGKVRIEKGTVAGAEGVAVLVGSNYADKTLRKGSPLEVTADRPVSVCVPVAPIA